jgi:hypothetical protein
MCGPPESEGAASPKAAPKSRSSKQQRTYTIQADVQVFIAALLPLSFPLLSLLTSWGPQR